jgi:D-alanyl-D-alanine-carboxypeptidase/D-alanyl-D-alanine-endopeptidase
VVKQSASNKGNHNDTKGTETNTMRINTCIGALLLAVFLHTKTVCAADVAAPEKIDALVQPLVEGGWMVGAAVGLIDENGTQIRGYGRISENDAQAPRADTVFEIGSISKVFTGLLLAQMVEDGLVKLDQPVQQLLGDTMTVPKGEREITLADLVTHSSGLPRMPGNFKPKDPTNPYADYSVEQMAQFLADHKLARQPGVKSEYSNLGMGLLGHALALKSGGSYETLLLARICKPLEMGDTRITLDDSLRSRLAQGHDADGNPVANWDLPTLAGAGAIRSTAADMLKFLAANLGLTKTGFDEAIANTHRVHFATPAEGGDEGLAWQIRRSDRVIWHNGQTGGYHSFAGFSPEKRVGVVVLVNSTSMYSDAVGFQLLKLLMGGDPEPLKLPKAIQVVEADLEPLVGRYQLSPIATVTISREKDQLFVQLTGQPAIKFYPESKTRFFCRLVEAAVSFEADEDGQIARLVIHQGGQDLKAARIK